METLPSRSELVDLLRGLLDEDRHEDLIQLVLRILEAMDQRHAEALLKQQRSERERYARKSEKLDARQLELIDQVLDQIAEAQDDRNQPDYEVDESQPADPERVSARRAKARRRRVLDRLPPDVPRETLEIPVPESQVSCPDCGVTREPIGHETSAVLEYQPGRFHVVEHAREKRACPRCQKGVVTAPTPAKVRERGAYGSSLISHVVVAKYNDHLPLYRQSQQFKREGVPLARSTLGDLVTDAARELRPLAEAIQEQVLASDYVQTDDTGLRVLRRDAPKDETKRLRGHYWPYRSGDWVYVDYTPTREGAGPQRILERFQGYLQVDGYAAYHGLVGPGSGRVEVGCWAHTRRHFHWAEEAGEQRAVEMLGRIAALYRIESQAQERGLDPLARQALRQERALPILEEMRAWLDKQRGDVPPRSELGKAIRYTQRRMQALRVYTTDGRLEIDNNTVERLIRGIAVGRRNYLFAGSDAGAERGAILYTLIWTARMHGLEPRAYLQDVLQRIAAGWPQRERRALLPDVWIAAHPNARHTTRPA